MWPIFTHTLVNKNEFCSFLDSGFSYIQDILDESFWTLVLLFVNKFKSSNILWNFIFGPITVKITKKHIFGLFAEICYFKNFQSFWNKKNFETVWETLSYRQSRQASSDKLLPSLKKIKKVNSTLSKRSFHGQSFKWPFKALFAALRHRACSYTFLPTNWSSVLRF